MCTIMVYTGRDMSVDTFGKAFAVTRSRGPDGEKIITLPRGGIMGFQRLSIMGLTASGMQPFELDGNYAVCNGELYGFRPVKAELERKGYRFSSDSDCEIILPLYKEYGTAMFARLDAEYAMVIYDAEKDDFVASRDPIGIRPLFYGYSESGKIVFASEAKNLEAVKSFSPPKPKTSSISSTKSGLFRRGAITPKGSSTATATSPPWKNIPTTALMRSPAKYARNWYAA